MPGSSDERVTGGIQSEPSFSIIYFTGDVRQAVPRLLSACRYTLLSQTPYRQLPFTEAEHLVAVTPGRSRDIVYKAVYSVASGTVLLDPEMVVGLNDEPIAAFCKQYRVDAIVAIWERVSQSIIARRLNQDGVRVDLMMIHGQAQRPPINPPSALVASPGPASLKKFLAESGALLDQLFGSISVSVLELDETNMAQPR